MTKEEAYHYIDNLKWLKGYDNTTIGGKTIGEILDEIKAMLKEQEEKTGHWTNKRTLWHDGEWYCDRCDYEPTVFEETPFCPCCGAKMKGGEQDEL